MMPASGSAMVVDAESGVAGLARQGPLAYSHHMATFAYKAYKFFFRATCAGICLSTLMTLGACSGNTTQRNEATAPPPAALVQPPALPPTADAWQPLMTRLQSDGIAGQDVTDLFIRLGNDFSPDPMGRKVKELYTTKYLKPAPVPGAPAAPRPRLYPGVVTDENASKCRAFIDENQEAFAVAERTYGVPRNVAASLLFVETRLGSNLGKRNAFQTLASMAASNDPEQITGWLDQLPGSRAHLDWVQEKMRIKSDWAYQELKALLIYSRRNQLDPFTMPGSIYGAIGICQFMPTSLLRYGADGDGDGRINLFATTDAVASLGRYLKEHGWQAGLDRDAKHKVLRRYNNLAIYADTILALSDKVATTGAQATEKKIPRQQAQR